MLNKPVQLILVSVIILLLSGCGETNTELDDIVVDLSVTLNEFTINENDEYITTSNDVTLEGEFELKTVTLLQNDFGEFPYITVEVSTDLDQYSKIASDLLQDLGENQLSNGNNMITRPKAKLSVSIENEEYIIILDFYQCEDNNICSSSMTIANGENTYVFNNIDDVATEYFNDINKLLE